MAALSFADIAPGLKHVAGPYRVEREEMMAFARKWDPRADHVDEEAARAGPFGGVTASSSYVISVRTALLYRIDEFRDAIIATLGWTDLSFPRAVRPGDELTLECEWIDKRLSKSQPDRGLATQTIALRNQNGEIVLSYRDTVMVRAQ